MGLDECSGDWKKKIEIYRSSISTKGFVATRLVKYDDEIPQIGMVSCFSDVEVTVEWWYGGYTHQWIAWKKKGIPVTETFPRTAVIMSGITFSKSMRLNRNTIDELKMLYNAVELI